MADDQTDVPLHLRVPRSLVERIDRMVKTLSARPDAVRMGKPTRSSVLRAAVFAGMDALEKADAEQQRQDGGTTPSS